MPFSPQNEVNTNYSPTTVLTEDPDTNKISVSDKTEQIQNPQSSILPVVTNEVNLSNVSNSLTLSKEATPYTNSYEINWQLILFSISLIWLVGVVLYFLWHTIIYFRYTLKLKKNLVPAGCNAREIFSLVCSQNKITHAPKLCVSNNISSPVLFGFFKSTVIIPYSLENTNALSSILAHELTHYKRRDLWIKLLILFNESIHWFNPLVHLAAKHCNTEMELSCDEHVLQNYSDDARISYGNMMLNIVKNCHSEQTVLTTHFNPKSNSIKERFENILDNSHKRSGKNIIILILLLCLIANVLIACNIVKQSENESGSNNETQSSEVVSETTQTAIQDGYFIPTGGAGNLPIYGSELGEIIAESENLNEFHTKWYPKVGEYPCNTSDAKYLCGGSSYILIKNDGYYLYNFIIKKAKELTIPDGNYTSIHPVYEENTGAWVGLSVRNELKKSAFYSFKKQSFITDFSYDFISSTSAHGYICVTLDTEGDESILDFNSGKILFNFDKN